MFFVLRDHCRLPLVRLHSFSQGEVINDLLVRRRVGIGMVDEDPGRSHHRLRDTMQLELENEDIEVRKRDGRHLLVLKPDLEQCFLRSIRRLHAESALPAAAPALRAILNLPNHPKHVTFRQELAQVRELGRSQGVATFVTRLEDAVGEVVRDM